VTRQVVLEVQRGPNGMGPWAQVGSVAEAEPAGSVHSDEPDGFRYVYLFGWLPDGQRPPGHLVPGVWISVLGVDVENEAVREVSSVALRQLADLNAGPYEVDLWRRPVAKSFVFHVRFRLVGSFTCPRCGRASQHPTDVAEGYCGHCHAWTAR
jgi:hypothetical protein